jgi:hypothetical protein
VRLLLVASVGFVQAVAEAQVSDGAIALLSQCRVTDVVIETRQGRVPPAPPDDHEVAARLCGQLREAAGRNDSGRVEKLSAELIQVYARLDSPPATFPQRLAGQEAKAANVTGIDRFVMLATLAKAAFNAGESGKAKAYADELLESAGKFPGNWNYGNAVYYGHFVLGRIALREGQLPRASEHLLKSGKTPGSPQLNTFGPNMSLAKELLEKGQTAPVLEFFALCGKFWKMDRGVLAEWSSTVRGGGIPRFTQNLNY